ncbi:heavy-metal-associated domain-containing protein [Streptomyces xiaopingdaonensis]|uniref:heavy-metal-associated domain-containing protein n=1 Tax=Streptomyces xiaopingdaonensis TaxID=1565415 RepID=UPI00031613F8|nr:heavy-metal-associated domain-containing protein [Streptomyces xiaopingdaonensis]
MTTTTFKVTGMSCGHCESAVSEELSGIEGVSEVRASAASGEVTVVSEGPVDEEALAAAVDEAGYELVAGSTTRS